jgi:cytochrome oxidase Cu insertion factor (SCO1/SenC/PrrC family)
VKAPRVLTLALLAGVVAFALAQKTPEVWQRFTPRGPAVGERLPAFELADQAGVVRNFESLRGSRGLVLVFFQSADW